MITNKFDCDYLKADNNDLSSCTGHGTTPSLAAFDDRGLRNRTSLAARSTGLSVRVGGGAKLRK
jgi:hypothetical protein